MIIIVTYIVLFCVESAKIHKKFRAYMNVVLDLKMYCKQVFLSFEINIRGYVCVCVMYVLF